MRKILIPALVCAPLLLGGCVASAAWSVATAPVKAASKAVDMATTSQEEADRNYGRKARKAEAREGRDRRGHDKECRGAARDCEGYDGYRAEDHRDD